jgi:hypothetical protein
MPQKNVKKRSRTSTSQTLGKHLTDCVIADVTSTYIKLVSFPNISYTLHINSRKINGLNRSGIEYLNECYNVFIIDRSIKSDYT